ncbi:DUF1173 family protein [Pseudorhodoferax sp. Leaf267]|uniref:DUF1173 family protein n=1 Tax=Pseudorhodoferax sp. Leaf267 TaxID=1736316 RepID=UPI0006FE441E|nr:DUF1173 family protein [Pseudorhodoferax sp. Leaf267]KQP23350.1 hypothetical protein ASF43_05675 [Pseudorhodoferax sp. Leaf267]
MDIEVDGPAEAQRFQLRAGLWQANDAALQQALARAHAAGERPRCLCMAGGVEMYIARHERFLVKRMPQTGDQHHPACPSYAPDGACSGLGRLVGDAVLDTGPDRVALRVDFPWARLAGRGSPPGARGEPGDVASPRHRMSLRAVLHYLLERAGFNRWTPAMAGKRNQAVLRKYLMEAAAGVTVNGSELAERLYVPEPFDERRKEAQAAQRRECLAITRPEEGRSPMVLVIGDLKRAEPGDLYHRLWIRHMPDTPLLLAPQGWGRLVRAYRPLLEAHDAQSDQRLRLLVAALVRCRRPFAFEVDTASLMLASRDWIPLEGLHELPLVEALIAQQRRFFKPLRYDASAALFANALLLDAGPAPVPLHLNGDFLQDTDRALKMKSMQSADSNLWSWNSCGRVPDLPPRSTSAKATTASPRFNHY